MRFICFLVLAAFAHGQELGKAPELSLNSSDLFKTYRLPQLKDQPSGPIQADVARLKVGKRAQALHITGDSAIEAWELAQTMARARAVPASAALGGRSIDFSGTKTSELNDLLAKPDTGRVKVVQNQLIVDAPLVIGHAVQLDLSGTTLQSVAPFAPYLIRIEHANGASINGGIISSGDSAILVNQSENVALNAIQIKDVNEAGILIINSSKVTVRNSRIEASRGAPILLLEGATSNLVERNTIMRNQGFSNMSASIVISDRHVDLTLPLSATFAGDGYVLVERDSSQRLQPPRDNLIAFNHVTSNRSSGIYVDGGILNTIVGNTIERNGKEGICFDNGSTANIATWNLIQQNGGRWGEPDSILAREYIASAGRLSDGTAASKVPGISMDNALYNIIYSNTITHNFGGGIKIVRTGYYNLIGANTLISNNDGASLSSHYFGVEMGSSPLDFPSAEIDATPSRANIIFSNMIRGNHYAGIFFGMDSDQNDAFDNVIMDSSPWSLESVKPMPNSSVNNFTNVPTRNISAGLSNAILK